MAREVKKQTVYVMDEQLKEKIQEWLEDYIRYTANDIGPKYKAANEIVFEFKYLKPYIRYITK